MTKSNKKLTNDSIKTLDELVVSIAKLLDELKIRYFITGSFALAFWGNPRTTLDIDLVVQLKTTKIDILVDKLASFGDSSHFDKEAIVEAIDIKSEWNFIHGETGTKVDFWAQKDDPWSKAAIGRLVKVKINKYNVCVSSPEDLIVSKLLWHKESLSARQFEDAQSIITTTQNFDWQYVRKWAEKLGLDEELRKLK